MYIEQSTNEKLQNEYAIKGLTIDQLNMINDMSAISHLHCGGDFELEISEKIHTCINEQIVKQTIKNN